MVTGSYSHRHPALQAVRHAVEAQAPDVNGSTVSLSSIQRQAFSDIKAVIGSAITTIKNRYGLS
jgi:hypothetical protein